MKDFLRVYAEIGEIDQTCRIVGLDRQLVYRWRATNPEFNAKFQHVQSVLVHRLENMAFKLALKGDAKLIMFLLERRYKEAYGKQLKLEAQGPADGGEFRVAGRERQQVAVELAKRILEEADRAEGKIAIEAPEGSGSMAFGARAVIDSSFISHERPALPLEGGEESSRLD